MRVEFAEAIEKVGTRDKNVVFFTGDLGFNALENVQLALKERFINAGVAEQNMIGVAAGLAAMGFQTWTYSIAPFITLKAVEQVRNDICRLSLDVKLVGNGGGYGYGIRGATHHALEDVGILTSLKHMKVYVPAFSEDVAVMVEHMYREHSPSYLRLGLSENTSIRLPPYEPFRRILRGKKVALVVLGPLIHHALAAVSRVGKSDAVDLWSITELPFSIPQQLLHSISDHKKLVVVEEHIKAGGLGEKLLCSLQEKHVVLEDLIHLYAGGYPSGRYGSQEFHRRENDLDSLGIQKHIRRLL